MIEGIPDWVRIAALVAMLLLVPIAVTLGQRRKRRSGSSRRWDRG